MKPTYVQLVNLLRGIVAATPADRVLLIAQAHDLLCLVEPQPANSVIGCPLPQSVQALALSGRKLDAIRLLRTDYGIGLVLAKDAVEAFIATENLRREARLLAPPRPTCGTCLWLRRVPAPPSPGDTEPVCAHESEAHPLHWCRPVGNPDAFGCTFHAPKGDAR